jgi:hypothetical protein
MVVVVLRLVATDLDTMIGTVHAFRSAALSTSPTFQDFTATDVSY